MLNPFCLFPPAVIEQTIVSVSYSPPSNSSTAEHHFFPLLPGPDNTEQPEGERRQLSLSIRAKPTDLPQRQQSILPRAAGQILLCHGPAATCVDWGRKEVVDITILLAVQIRRIAAKKNPFITA